MVKQAALEMWQGFWRNIRSWSGLAAAACLVGITILYGMDGFEGNMWTMYLFYFPVIMGQLMGCFMGGRTGKLSMVLPISPKDRKKLIFTKALLAGLLELLFFGVLYLAIDRGFYRSMQEIALILLPAVMLGTQVFLQYMVPAKNINSEKGYRFSFWLYMAGLISLVILSVGYEREPIYIKILLSAVSYALIGFNYWKMGNTIEYQMIYYDVVEKEAERVHW